MQDAKTGMHCKNLAIVWAPNLLKFVYSEYLLCICVCYCYFIANNNNIQQHIFMLPEDHNFRGSELQYLIVS